jgi:hypothetical protein
MAMEKTAANEEGPSVAKALDLTLVAAEALSIRAEDLITS